MYFIDYQNHYDTVSNKCYILITSHFGTINMGNTYRESVELYDVEDRILLGELINSGQDKSPNIVTRYCKILGKECHSLDDFKPYMQNKINQ